VGTIAEGVTSRDRLTTRTVEVSDDLDRIDPKWTRIKSLLTIRSILSLFIIIVAKHLCYQGLRRSREEWLFRNTESYYPLISSIIAAGVWGGRKVPTGGFGGLAPQDKFGFWTKNSHFINSSNLRVISCPVKYLHFGSNKAEGRRIQDRREGGRLQVRRE